MRAVDTNVLVRLLVRDDPKQVHAAEDFISAGAWVSHLVLVETVWVLDAVFRRSATQIATAIDMLLDHGTLAIQDSDIVAAALELFRSRPAVGFSDCLVAEVSRKAGHLPVGTFDRSLAKVDGVAQIREKEDRG